MISALNFLYSFLTDGLPIAITLTPFYIILRWLFIKKIKYKKIINNENFKREIILYAFFVFLLLLFTQTFIVNAGENHINLVPFSIIIYQFNNINSSYNVFILNIIGNIIIFIPIGIFIAYLFKTKFLKTTFYGFLISAIIETVQLPLPRTTDVDDLILNTTGTIIGYIIYKIIKKLYLVKHNNIF